MRTTGKTASRASWLLLLITLALPDGAAGQVTLMEPTAELRRLDTFSGVWTRRSQQADEPSGTIEVIWGPGDVWMTWNVAVRVGQPPVAIAGRRQIAWDRRTDDYRWSWLDTQSARINQGSGSWIADSTLELLGDPFDWGEHTFRFRTRLTVLGPDSIHEEVWRRLDGGEWTKQNEAEWRRVAGTWSADTATLLYTSDREGNGELYVQRGMGDDAEPRNLTRHAGPDGGGRWFPGGDRIAFQSVRDGNFEIYVMAADGTGEAVNLTNHPDHDLLPEPSPDGAHLLFFSTRGEQRGPRGEFVGNLWRMKADGTELVRLTTEPLTSSYGGSWSPDGATVLFARDVGDNVELFVMNADGTGERRRHPARRRQRGGRALGRLGARDSMKQGIGLSRAPHLNQVMMPIVSSTSQATKMR